MIYQKVRKIHQFFMFPTVFLTLVMWLTGQVMESGWPIFTDFQARQIHRLVSKFFTVSLIIMIISGLLIYFYPYYQKWQSKN